MTQAILFGSLDTLVTEDGSARPGVVETVTAALAMNVPLALVADAEEAEDRLAPLAPAVAPAVFRVVSQSRGAALEVIGLAPEDAVAVEADPRSARAAVAEGIPTIAFPDATHADRRFRGVDVRVERLTPALFSFGPGVSDDTHGAWVA